MISPFAEVCVSACVKVRQGDAREHGFVSTPWLATNVRCAANGVPGAIHSPSINKALTTAARRIDVFMEPPRFESRSPASHLAALLTQTRKGATKRRRCAAA